MIWAVVVTRCRPVDLRRCLAALAAQSRPPDRILVVDNADSAEGSARVPRNVELLSLGGNSGSAGGQRAGWERAFGGGASAVWAMDDDCEPSPRALEVIVDQAIRHPQAVLTCLVQDRETRLMGPLVRTLPGIPCRPRATDVIHSRDAVAPGDIRDGVFWNWGHFFLGTFVPLSVFRSVGPVDQRYFIRGEDYEYLLRCLRSAPVGVVMDSLMNHPMSHSRGKFDEKSLYELRNHVSIDRQYFPSLRTSALGMAACCLRDVIHHPESPAKICQAYWAGLRNRF